MYSTYGWSWSISIRFQHYPQFAWLRRSTVETRISTSPLSNLVLQKKIIKIAANGDDRDINFALLRLEAPISISGDITHPRITKTTYVRRAWCVVNVTSLTMIDNGYTPAPTASSCRDVDIPIFWYRVAQRDLPRIRLGARTWIIKRWYGNFCSGIIAQI